MKLFRGEFFLPPFQKLIAEAETDNAAVGNWHRKPKIP